MAFVGELETHITVAPVLPEQWGSLQDWAVWNAAKCTWIELAAGKTLCQPMVSWRGRGTLVEEQSLCADRMERLRERGLNPVRAKIECAPHLAGVPQADADWSAVEASRYFEHHVKLLLPEGSDLGALTSLVRKHGGHLSRNAFRCRPDGQSERFITQRFRRCGRATAAAGLGLLIESLRLADHLIVDVESEYVIYDSREALDAGWLPDGGDAS